MNEKITRVREVLQTIKENTTPVDNEKLVFDHWNVVDEMLFDLDKSL